MKFAPLYNYIGIDPTESANPEIVVGEIVNITIRATDIKPLLSVRCKNGELFHNVETVIGNGSNGYGYFHTPMEIGGYVYLLKTYANSPPVCLGGAVKPGNLPVELNQSVASAESDRKAFNTRDMFLYNDGSRVNLSHLNGLVLDSEKMIRMQLGEEAALRISRYGASTDNVLDGSEFIDLLFAYIKLLEEKLNQHSQWIENATPIVNQQFIAAAAEHTSLAAAANAIPDPVTFQRETQNALEDTEAAAQTLTLGATAGQPVSITADSAKEQSRAALNPYIQTPFKG